MNKPRSGAPHRLRRRLAGLCLGLAGLCQGSLVAGMQDVTGLSELSLEELLNIQVTSVARKPQALSESAAAVFVITADDIRRAGVTSIPEALRLVPGLHVARIDSSKWAISARGFNGQFANKLLVLMDGRTLYNPLFSGVFWDTQDTVLDDIERIEVIRGPGASLWGSNAVNGIINIITKDAAETQGGLAKAGTGTLEKGFATLRYGAALGEHAHARVYAKYFERSGFVDPQGEDTPDDWRMARGGFRVDYVPSTQDHLTLQGDLYDGRAGQVINLPVVPRATPRQAMPTAEDADLNGGNVLARWARTLSETSGLELQLYYDRVERDEPLFHDTLDTLDVDFQHRFTFAERHAVVWGLGYRYTHDDASGREGVLFVERPTRDAHRYSGFVQDDVTLLPERLRLTLGTKLEHNEYSGFEVQPNARVLWKPAPHHTLWGAISRAVRTPTRVERDLTIVGHVLPPGALGPGTPGVVTTVSGTERFGAESVVAYELGYRMRLGERISFDLAAFYNDYAGLRVAADRQRLFDPGPPPLILNRTEMANDMDGFSYGAEAYVDWRPLDRWRLQLAYTFLQMDLEDHSSAGLGDELTEGMNPRHRVSLRSSMDLPRDVDLDLWLRYDGRLERFATTDPRFFDYPIGGTWELDARLAWRPRPNLELSVVGQNLLHAQHPEFIAGVYPVPVEVPRSVYGQIRWTF